MYIISNDQIIHETIDGEAMIVNLSDGAYYSTAATGAFVWQLVMQGNSVDSCISACQCKYDCSSVEQLGGLVENFVNELLSEGLIHKGSSNDVREFTDQKPDTELREAFSIPALYKYSDMQDLLLLDPIHDVDESGWPNPKNGSS